MTVDELAHYLRIHASTIYRLLKKKQLPGFKAGRDWRFNQSQIDGWVASQEKRCRQLTEKISETL